MIVDVPSWVKYPKHPGVHNFIMYDMDDTEASKVYNHLVDGLETKAGISVYYKNTLVGLTVPPAVINVCTVPREIPRALALCFEFLGDKFPYRDLLKSFNQSRT